MLAACVSLEQPPPLLKLGASQAGIVRLRTVCGHGYAAHDDEPSAARRVLEREAVRLAAQRWSAAHERRLEQIVRQEEQARKANDFTRPRMVTVLPVPKS